MDGGSDWLSVDVPDIALMATTPMMTSASARPPVAMEMPARCEKPTGRELNCPKNDAPPDGGRLRQDMGPNFCQAGRAAFADRPVRRESESGKDTPAGNVRQNSSA